MRVCGLLLALLVGVGTMLALSAAPADGKRPSACQRLKGKDIAPAPKVKLVRRRNEELGTDLRGCVLPRGRVHLVALSSNLETSWDDYRVVQVAGRFVLLETTHSDQYASATNTLVFDLRTGRTYGIAHDCARIGSYTCDGPRTTAAAAFVNRRGQAAAAIVPVGGDTTTIAGFSSRAQRTDFDSGLSVDIPASSLRLEGRTVSWTHSGEERTATLSG
jgi:hypothetical protein